MAICSKLSASEPSDDVLIPEVEADEVSSGTSMAKEEDERWFETGSDRRAGSSTIRDSEAAIILLDLNKRPVISELEFVDPIARKMTKNKGKKRQMLVWEMWEEELEDWFDNWICESETPDLDHKDKMIHEMRREPADLLTRLLRFQKEWLSWALKQEESAIRGGILADEMGMGKTVQMIALVLAKREIHPAINRADQTFSASSSSSALPEVNCTLVICPTSAIHQWEREISLFTQEGTTKVLCYQGNKRVKDSVQFSGYDFVITTYSTIEKDYRSFLQKVGCQWCGKQLYERKMAFHLEFMCGPHKLKTVTQSKKRRNKSHLKLSLDPDEGDLSDTDVSKSALHCVKWERIVLDEAHCIKGTHTNTARAVFALESSYKWALTGTPIQNRFGDINSMICFLQISPYSYYFCKDCDCRVPVYSSSVECKKCGHKASRHFFWWHKYVAAPEYQRGGKDGKRALTLWNHKIRPSILLRRTKSERASDLALPPRIISVRRDSLDVKEEEFYQSLSLQTQAKLNTPMINFAEVFSGLIRMRQAVNHPYLVTYSPNMLKNESNVEEQACGICQDRVDDLVVTSCGHPFCKTCLLDSFSILEEQSCPSCSTPLATADTTSKSDSGSKRNNSKVKGFRSSSILNSIPLDDFQTSTKIEALREEIRFMIERDGSAKGIVFSQYVPFLDLIMYSLVKSGITCVFLHGSMDITARENSIKKFNEDPDCRIFLISLKSGGFALNLTVASHVFMMDLWWNPAVERQAMDRIHRIGQFKPIRIVRFVIEGTIDERLLKLQETKKLVFDGIIAGSSDALSKLTKDDLIYLSG